jgi:hypothetical protein
MREAPAAKPASNSLVPTIPFFISGTLKGVYYMHDGGAFKKKSDSSPALERAANSAMSLLTHAKLIIYSTARAV